MFFRKCDDRSDQIQFWFNFLWFNPMMMMIIHENFMVFKIDFLLFAFLFFGFFVFRIFLINHYDQQQGDFVSDSDSDHHNLVFFSFKEWS